MSKTTSGITYPKLTAGLRELNIDSAYVGGYSVLTSGTPISTTSAITTTSSITSGSQITSNRDFITTNSNWRIGASEIFNTATIALSAAIGCYKVTSSGWTTTGSSHVIDPTLFILNTEHRNIVGTFTIYCSDKVRTGTARAGVIRCDYLYSYGATAATVMTISTTKSSNLTTFSVTNTASSAGITVSTDSVCRVAWVFEGAI